MSPAKSRVRQFFFPSLTPKFLVRVAAISLSAYFLFGLIFSYSIHTHDYYHLQFIPAVALSLGALAAGPAIEQVS